VKIFLALVTIAIVSASLVAGCVGEVKTYTNSGQAINIGVNQEFVIALGSNPTTGYSWQESHDENVLELVETKYEPTKEVEQGKVGAGGVEYFRFRALKKGNTEITLVYKRAWEEDSLDKKVFVIAIK